MSQNPDATVPSPIDGLPVHPVIANHLREIAELRRRVEDTETKVQLKSQQSMVRPGSTISKRSMESIDFGRPNSAFANMSKTTLDFNPRVTEVIEKAKEDIRQELRVLHSRKSLRGASTPSIHSRRGRDSRKSLTRQNEREKEDGDGDDFEDESDATEETESEEDENENPVAAEDHMLNMLEQIQNDITIKEELVTQLEKTQSEYQAMKEKYEEKMRQLQDNLMAVQRERDTAIKRTDTTDDKDKIALLRVKYEDKIKKLSNEINETKRRYQEQQQELMAKKSNNETLIKNMKVHVENLKQEKLRLLKRMKERENQSRERDTARQQEISRLKRKENQLTELTKKLEKSNQMQRILLKRRTEEHVQAQSKLRSVMQMLKKTRPVSSPISKNRIGNTESRRVTSNNHLSSRESPTQTNRQRRAIEKLPFGPTQESLTHREEERLRMQATFKKNLLYHAINNFVTSKQVNDVAEGLMRKRESLSLEKQELLAEIQLYDDNITAAERLNATDPVQLEKINQMIQQRQDIESRIEIINAEVKYLSSRIHSIQVEAAEAQGGDLAALNNSISNIKITAPDMASSYDNAVELLKSLEEIELRQLVELMTEDLIAMKLADRTRQLEVQELEKETEDLRDALHRTRKAAIESTLENQRKLIEYETKIKVGSPVPLRVDKSSKSQDKVRLSIIQDVQQLQGDLEILDQALDAVDELPEDERKTPSRSRSVAEQPPSKTVTFEPKPLADIVARETNLSQVQSLSNVSISSSQSFPSLTAINVSPSLPPASAGTSKPTTPSSLMFNAALANKDRDRNPNVFERLHREQTISSQAKVKEAAHAHAQEEGPQEPIAPSEAEQTAMAPIEKLLNIRNQIQKAIFGPRLSGTSDANEAPMSESAPSGVVSKEEDRAEEGTM